MNMIDGEVFKGAAHTTATFAAALGVDEHSTQALSNIAEHHLFLARLDVVRRTLGRFVSKAWHDEHLRGVQKFMGSLFKVGEDPHTAARYRAMSNLPEGSFGHAYWYHCTSRGFGLPGERGGIPELAIFHDLGHVLSGYDTNPEGEIQQAAFQAGFVRNDGFIFLFFGIAQFHLGMKLTPVAEPEVGLLDVDKVMVALGRGASCTVDLSDHWDFWPLLSLPLQEVRNMLHVPPLLEPGAT